MMYIGKNEKEAMKNCIEISKQNKNKYVYATTAFGLFATIEKKLNVFAPSDTPFNWYVRNGKVKQFTKAQWRDDQISTPIVR